MHMLILIECLVCGYGMLWMLIEVCSVDDDDLMVVDGSWGFTVQSE